MSARHLHPVAPEPATMLTTREEIAAWINERRVVLAELLAREPQQLELEDERGAA